MRSEFRHWTPLEVRWPDVDQFQHVNNAVYFTYMEAGRVAYFRDVGLAHYLDAARGRPGSGPAIVRAECNFRAQLRFPATLDIGSRVSEIRTRSFVIASELYRAGSDEMIADGLCVTVWMDYEAGQALALPPDVVAAIEGHEGRRLQAARGAPGTAVS